MNRKFLTKAVKWLGSQLSGHVVHQSVAGKNRQFAEDIKMFIAF